MSLSRFKELEPVVVGFEKKQSLDFKFWSALQFPITIQEFGAVTNVAFQQSKPNYFVVTASNRLEIYDPENNELVKSFTRFPKTAYGATFRSDGKLLVAGSEDSRVRLFDVEGQAALRTFKGHRGPVHVSKFLNETQVYSAGDDKDVRLWDVATESCLNALAGHEDYIRCGCSSITSNNILFTGSYDHTVRMHDTRTNGASMVVNHGCPVESVLVYPSGSILLSAGGNTIKVWDILQGGKHLATVSHHHKTITCMCFNHDCTRLMSGSLDRHVKIYDVASYGVVHNIDYPAAILSMDISNKDTTLVVGMVDKMLSIRHRKTSNKHEETRASRRKAERAKFLKSGETYIPNSSDVTILHERKKEMKKYDICFRKFQHSKALDQALHNRVWGRRPEVTVAVMEELIRRDMLNAALAGRVGKDLTRLLQFILRNITNEHFSTVLLDVTEKVLDIYSTSVEELSVENIQLFERLKNIIEHERECQFELEKLAGCLQTIVRSNAQTLHLNALKNQEIN